MAFKALVTVGSYELPEPSSYSANTSTIVDSARNLEGRVVGAVVREDIAKVEIGWRYLTAEQWSQINLLFKEGAGGSFYNEVTFFDQTTASYVTRTMYVSDRKAGMWRRHPETYDVMGWTDCAFSLVEV